MSDVIRPRHRLVLEALGALHADALMQADCFFGGGTRIALALGEYRESADVDFLCASRAGYRALRASVTNRSLGIIAKRGVKLAREVIADRYGIRTFLDVNGEKLKFEIVLEARIALTGGMERGLPVPVLDQTSCFAEKFLANADRWLDSSVNGRDVIDLAFMAAHWGDEPLRAGFHLATEAYGKAVASSAKRAATKMIEQAAWRKRCVSALDVKDGKTLLKGLKVIVAGVG
jgi:hypothetical protein